MRFTDAYALPLCSPARASILTGQYSSRHGITSASGHRPAAKPFAPYPAKGKAQQKFIYPNSKNYLEPKLVTLAEVLKGQGYRTGHFGKWHLGLMPEHWPETQGFETTWHCAPDPGPPSYFSPYGVSKEGRPTGQNKVGNITDGPDGEYITDRLTDEAIKFIDAHQDEPFYLNLWQYGVHGPWGHKLEYTRKFIDKKDPRGQQSNAIMASMLKSVDDSLGRVMKKLDDLRLTENTLFIFYSDNGGNTHSNIPDSKQQNLIKPGHPKWAFMQDWKKWAGDQPPTNNHPLREGKGRIYEGGQRVPLMVRWPGKIKPATTTDAIVGPIDLYPTVLDALNIPLPGDHIVDGKSFLPVLRGTGEFKREALFTWFPHLVPAVSVRAGDWKLIQRWEPHASYPETRALYNLKKDIGETTNLAKKNPAKLKEMEGLISKFIKDTGALEPKPNPDYQERTNRPQANRDPVNGLVPKFCEISNKSGFIQVTGENRPTFLGTAQARFSGKIAFKMTARSKSGGEGKLVWKTTDQEDFSNPDQEVTFKIPAGEGWQEIEAALPVKGAVQIIRLYLPAQSEPVDIQSISYSAGQRNKTWDFKGLK